MLVDDHFDEDAEKSVIFSIANGTSHAPRLFKELKKEDFFNDQCRRRFERLHRAYTNGQLIEFAAQHSASVDAPGNLLPLWDAVGTIVNHSIRRRIVRASMEVAEKCADYSESVGELQLKLKDAILEAIDSRCVKAPSSTNDDLKKVIDGMQNSTSSFYTGIPTLDDIAPIQYGDFVIIAARPGVGKSALLTGMALNNFMPKTQNRKGLFFCIEMDARQNYARLSSHLSNVPLEKYINAKRNPPTESEMQELSKSIASISERFPERWFIEGAVSIDDICEMTAIYKPDFIMVDYVQIVKSSGEGHERLAGISTKLRMLALEQNVAVIAVAQLNRDANGAVPSMSQIKGSGQFEQDATHIFLLDRPESERLNTIAKRNYYDRRGNAVEIMNQVNPTNKAVLICCKNRNGPTFYEILNFNPKTTSFTPYET